MFVPRELFKHDHRYRTVSRKSVRRFLNLMRLIPQGHLLYHQTLSFPAYWRDVAEARSRLERFLKTVCKRFQECEMGAVFAEEFRRNGTVHYHVYFFFFDESLLPFDPSRRRRDLRTYLFKRWKSVNGGNCAHRGNSLTVREFSPMSVAYLVKTLQVPEKSPPRDDVVWWGKRKREVFQRRPPANVQVDSAFERYFRKGRCRRRLVSRTCEADSSLILAKERLIYTLTDRNPNDGGTL